MDGWLKMEIQQTLVLASEEEGGPADVNNNPKRCYDWRKAQGCVCVRAREGGGGVMF